MLDDGTTLVRKSGVLLNGMIWLGVPPGEAFLNAAAMGAGNGLPVTWLGATSGTSSGATPWLVQRKPSGSRISVARMSRMLRPVAAETISRINGPR